MRRFIKPDSLGDLNDENLVRLDVTDKKNHVEYKQVDVGFSSEKALKKDGHAHVPSTKQIRISDGMQNIFDAPAEESAVEVSSFILLGQVFVLLPIHAKWSQIEMVT